MAIIVEDGTHVDNANSFVDVATCRTFCSARGLTLPTADAEVEVLLIKAMDYLQSLETKFQGSRENTGQELVFPRKNISFFGESITGEIPLVLKNAQCRLAYDWSKNDLQKTGTDREVLKTKLGPMEKQFAETGSTSPQFTPVAALDMLEPLFDSDSVAAGGFNIIVDR